MMALQPSPQGAGEGRALRKSAADHAEQSPQRIDGGTDGGGVLPRASSMCNNVAAFHAKGVAMVTPRGGWGLWGCGA
jgi:hypothetical protein